MENLLEGLSPLMFELKDEKDLKVEDPADPNNGVARNKNKVRNQ